MIGRVCFCFRGLLSMTLLHYHTRCGGTLLWRVAIRGYCCIIMRMFWQNKLMKYEINMFIYFLLFIANTALAMEKIQVNIYNYHILLIHCTYYVYVHSTYYILASVYCQYVCWTVVYRLLYSCQAVGSMFIWNNCHHFNTFQKENVLVWI